MAGTLSIPIEHWLTSTAIRTCTPEERSAWIDLLCLFNLSDEIGMLRRRLPELASAVGCSESVLESLIRKRVLRGRSASSLPGDGLFEHSGLPLTYAPKHARRIGEEVILIDDDVVGDVYFCDWLVVQEHKRSRASALASLRPVPAAPLVAQPVEASPQALKTEQIKPEQGPAQESKAQLRCPHSRLVAEFAKAFPAAPVPRSSGTETHLGKALQTAWRKLAAGPNSEFSGYADTEEGVEKWRALFAFAAKSEFLRGECNSQNRTPFRISLDWLVGSKNLEKVMNGFYLQGVTRNSMASTLRQSAMGVAELMERRARAAPERYQGLGRDRTDATSSATGDGVQQSLAL